MHCLLSHVQEPDGDFRREFRRTAALTEHKKDVQSFPGCTSFFVLVRYVSGAGCRTAFFAQVEQQQDGNRQRRRIEDRENRQRIGVFVADAARPGDDAGPRDAGHCPGGENPSVDCAELARAVDVA